MSLFKKLSAPLVMMLFAISASAHQNVEFLNKGNSPDAPFSEAVRAGNTLYLAGKLGYISEEKRLAKGGIKAEAKQAMENIKNTLTKYGYDMTDVVKCTVMLADIKEWAAFNEVYKPYFEKGRYPARSAFGGNELALNARVEVECIAYKKH